jgi:hypothetical protein
LLSCLSGSRVLPEFLQPGKPSDRGREMVSNELLLYISVWFHQLRWNIFHLFNTVEINELLKQHFLLVG